MDFEISLSQYLKLRVLDFSLGCTREDVIIVNILGLISGQWQELGKTSVSILENNVAYWNDIVIGLDDLRCQGIGSTTVKNILSYLRNNKIKQVIGEISDIDEVEMVKNFWRKNGFEIVNLDKPDGCMIAKIRLIFS